MDRLAEDCAQNVEPFEEEVEKIILFGSYARNEQHFGSDVDLLFITKENPTIGFNEVYEYLVANWPEIEWAPQFMTKSEIEKRLEKNEFWIKSAMSDGIKIY